MSDMQQTGHDDFLLIGTIGVPFGVKGQVKLHTITTRPEQLRRIKTIFLGEKFTAVTLLRVMEQKHNVWVLTLSGINDRNMAETLRGAEVFIRERDAAPLEADEYFHHDLPGLRVETVSGDLVGMVTAVLETGANDVLVVARDEGGEVLIPIIHDVVKTMDIPGQRIVIQPMPGLLEE